MIFHQEGLMTFLKIAAYPGIRLALHADTAYVTLSHVIPILPLR